MRGRRTVQAMLRCGALAAVITTVAGGAARVPNPAFERPVLAAAGAPGPNSVSAFGDAAGVSTATMPAGAGPVQAIASTPTGGGYWLASAEGGVFAFGDAAFAGSASGFHPAQPVVGMAATPTGRGYWLVARDGGVFAFGDAAFQGSTGAMHLNQPIVGMAATPSGGGYWLVASDGGVFAFGDARFAGSMGATRLNQPVVGMAAGAGGGYWLVAADGGIFAFGGAAFRGSTGAIRLAAPVVGMAAATDGSGYWLVAADGGVFAFGAPFSGSDGGTSPPSPAVGMTARPGGGYWIAYGRNPFGPAMRRFVAGRASNVTAAVFDVTNGHVDTFRPEVVEHTASTLKVDILASVLVQAQAAGRSLTSQEQSLAVPMIEESLDSSANTFWGRLGPGAVADLERSVGMIRTVPATDGVWGRTTTTALDRIAMLRAVVFPNGVLTDSSRAYILDLMQHVTPSQRWGATGGVPSDVSVALKNGFSTIDGWQINTMGWVNGRGRNYLIAVLTDRNPTEQYGIATVDGVSQFVYNALAG